MRDTIVRGLCDFLIFVLCSCLFLCAVRLWSCHVIDNLLRHPIVCITVEVSRIIERSDS